MRLILTLAILTAALVAGPASAQSVITLRADPVPIVDVEIEGSPARLEVHLRFSQTILLNQSAADRLGVRTSSIGRRVVSADGATELHGRPIRPRVTIGGERVSAMAGVFAAPVTERADGIIGPFALPYEVVTIAIGADNAGMRDIVLPLQSNRNWTARADVGGQSMFVQFDLSQPRSIINRSASRLFDAQGAIAPDGAPTRETIILGLATRVQPVRTELRAFGLALAPAVARMDDPLLGTAGAETVYVEPKSPPPPSVTLGRESLSRCASITMNRRARTLTLRCAT